MAPVDPYRILGVGPTAPDSEVRAAYRRLVQRHHPDHNEGSAQATGRFEEVQDAYAEVRRRRARANSASRAREPARGSDGTEREGDPAIEARLAALENEVRAARAAADRAARTAADQTARAAADRAAREAAGAPTGRAGGRPSDEELGYVRTDDSFARILSDARGELGELLAGAREQPLARRVEELIDELTNRLEGRR